MKLGTVEIDEYVGEEVDVMPDAERRSVLKGMREKPYANEEKILQRLEFLELMSTANVREIDLGFLSISQKFKGEGFTKVPRFAVYLFRQNKFCGCEITVSVMGSFSSGVKAIFGKPLLEACSSNNAEKYKQQEAERQREMKEMMQQVGVGTGLAGYVYRPFLGPDLVIGYQIKSTFAGIIPNATKDRIEEAAKGFDEIALIAEATWQEEKIQTDPLIVGVLGDKAYLIDHFDATEKEKMVLEKFVL